MQERYKARYEEWTQTLAEWEASGPSGAAFCRERGIAYWKFLSWKQRLGRLTPAGSETDANDSRALKLEDEPGETYSAYSGDCGHRFRSKLDSFGNAATLLFGIDQRVHVQMLR